MKAMILAAGLGQRMRPLTQFLPKPLLRVKGYSLIEYHLFRLANAGIKEVIINHAYLGEKIVSHCGDGSKYGVNIYYSAETKPLETAGGITNALPLLGNEPFLLINGDIYCDIELKKLADHRLGHYLGHLIMVANPAFHPDGDFAMATPNQQSVGELSLESNARLTYAGIALLSPALLSDYPNKRESYPLGEVFRHAIDKHCLSGEFYAGIWSDIGTPERLIALHNQLSLQPETPKIRV